MDDIETAKNLTVKARTAYSVWDAMESLTTGRPYGLDSSAEDSSVSSDSSAEVILPAAKMVKERFDSIGNGMLSSQEASQAAIDLMLQNNKLLDNRKQLYKSIAIIIGRLPRKTRRELRNAHEKNGLYTVISPTSSNGRRCYEARKRRYPIAYFSSTRSSAALIGDLFIRNL
ncbi:Partitioning protein REP2 [Saccharomyces cerevisiae]|nr:Partitioning protein REP2 [Saccharomyces cerevisiae]